MQQIIINHYWNSLQLACETQQEFPCRHSSLLAVFNQMSDRWQRLSTASLIDTNGKKHLSSRGDQSVSWLSSDAIKEFPAEDLTAVLEALYRGCFKRSTRRKWWITSCSFSCHGCLAACLKTDSDMLEACTVLTCTAESWRKDMFVALKMIRWQALIP